MHKEGELCLWDCRPEKCCGQVKGVTKERPRNGGC